MAAVRSDPPHLGGIDRFGRSAADSPDAALAAAHEFLGAVFEHLCLFVGHDVAVRLVLPDSPELWRPAGPDEGPENDR